MSDPADTRTTIFALSSGALPAAIAVVRVSGPAAATALTLLAGRLPPPRRAVSAKLRDAAGELLDHTLILWFPGPATATGEDIAELHLHGGRAVAAAILSALAHMPGLRMAEAGEFTRRAFSNGRLDLAQAEGLADLLAAETEAQRRQAIRQTEGGLGQLIAGWRGRLLGLSAGIEAAIEFGEDEDDVPQIGVTEREGLAGLARELVVALQQPPAERLKDGVRIVVAGPTNAGKSSLINMLSGREAAIASPVAGTTRDIIEVPVVLAGMPCLLIDSAGLRSSRGAIERIGVARAKAAIGTADLILWLGPPDACPDPERAILVRAKADLVRRAGRHDIEVSSITGAGMEQLRTLIEHRVRALLPASDAVALNARHHRLVEQAQDEIAAASALDDPILIAEHLRHARIALDRVVGQAGVEEMLDALFGQFCIGK